MKTAQSQEAQSLKLKKVIVKCDLPFSIVDDKDVRDFWGSEFRIRCLCHCINTAVNHGLEVKKVAIKKFMTS